MADKVKTTLVSKVARGLSVLGRPEQVANLATTFLIPTRRCAGKNCFSVTFFRLPALRGVSFFRIENHLAAGTSLH